MSSEIARALPMLFSVRTDASIQLSTHVIGRHYSDHKKNLNTWTLPTFLLLFRSLLNVSKSYCKMTEHMY